MFTETDEPGGYRVRASRNDGALVDRPDDLFVVNIDMRESDLTPLPADRRPDRSRATAAPGDAAPKRRMELWHALATVVLLLVLFESLLTLRFRRAGGAR